MITAPSSGVAPPARPVPDPRATNGTPWATGDARRTPATSSVEVGKHTRAGCALDVRGVVAVQRQLGGAVADPVGRRARARSSATTRPALGGAAVIATLAGWRSVSRPAGAARSPGPTRPARRRRAPRRRVEVVAEAHQPTVALGAAARARVPARRRRPSLHGVGRHDGRRAARAAAPRRRRCSGAACSAAARPCAWPAGAGDAGRDPADEPRRPRRHHAPLRRRRTARLTCRWRAPAALITGRRQRRPRQPPAAADGVADRLGRAEHPVEALEVVAGLGPSPLRRRGRRRAAPAAAAGLGAQLADLAHAARSIVSRTRTSMTASAANASAHSTAATTSASSPHGHCRASCPAARRRIIARRPPARARGGWAGTSVRSGHARRAGTAGRPNRLVVVVMRVLVAGAVAERLGALVVGVAQVRRHLAERAGGDVGAGVPDGQRAAVALRRRGQVDARPGPG